MRDPDDILDLKTLAKALDLDPRTVKGVAVELGGKCFGNRWRFRWGTVMEIFNHADFTTGQRQSMVGAADSERPIPGRKILSGRAETGSGMDGRESVGGKHKTGYRKVDGTGNDACASHASSGASTGTAIPGRSGTGNEAKDPFGLRAALGVG